jgi:acyl-CoA thioesterase I
MSDDRVARQWSVFSCAMGVLLAALAPAHAQAQGTVTTQHPPACVVSAEQARFLVPLTHTAHLLAEGLPVKIVALGSSSTYGAGASSYAASYPSRLVAELARLLPGHEFNMLNRGVSGENAADMLARMDKDVIDERPDLILWQVGTNSLLQGKAVPPHASLLHEGLSRLKATGADVILVDPQYAPKVITKPNAEGMVSLIETAAKTEHVCIFHRFELMRQWINVDGLQFRTFLSPDGLHMNDWSYGCFAKWLAAAIAEAATRPLTTATAPRSVR